MTQKITRDQLISVLRRYRDTQRSGIKQIDEQIKLFREDCIFISFPVASVVGSAEPRLLHGRQALYEAFVAYNDYIMGQTSVTIKYVDAYAHPEDDGSGGTCGFTLLIEIINGQQTSLAMNQAQFHVDAAGLVHRMMNWQAHSTASIQATAMENDFN